MKIHSTFHISLLLFLKHNLMKWQVSKLLPVTIESKEDSYFVDSINNMRWQIQEAWFELLIKWEEYKQRTWELYMTIKKNTSTLMKEFHEDYLSQSASAKWAKDENKWLLSDKQITNLTKVDIMKTQNMKIEKNIKLTKITTSTLIKIKIWSSIQNTTSITHT